MSKNSIFYLGNLNASFMEWCFLSISFMKDLSWFSDLLHTTKMVQGELSPGKLVPHQIATRRFPLENCPLESCSLNNCPHQIVFGRFPRIIALRRLPPSSNWLGLLHRIVPSMIAPRYIALEIYSPVNCCW